MDRNLSPEPGLKVIANVGLIKAYGKKRTKGLTRLTRPAEKGSDFIFLEKGLDLVEGDEIALATTTYDMNLNEAFNLTHYDPVTGIATLETPVQVYHWG